MQQISFTGNLDNQSTVFFIIEEAKEKVFINYKSILIFFYFNIKTTHFNTLNVKFCHSKFNKLKSVMKNETKETLNLSSNVIDDSNDGNNFPPKLLLTNTQVSKILKVFANGSSANIKL